MLIATPGLFDFFRRTVVLMIEHSDEGAFGVVLNRISETRIAEAVPPLAVTTGGDQLVRIGGPVASESIVVLGEFLDPDESPRLVVGDIGVVDPAEDSQIGQIQVYAGHAGWTSGQLEEEIEREAWLVEPALPRDIFDQEDVWPEVLKRRGGDHALMATMPPDPTLN